MKANGPMIEKRADGLLNADAIRADGQSVADHIRQLAQKAKKEGEEVAVFAEEVAEAITSAADEVATRVADYMQKCQAARTSMKEHKEAMVVIPPRQPQVGPSSDAYTSSEQAVAEALKLR